MVTQFPLDVMHLVGMGDVKALIKVIMTRKLIDGDEVDGLCKMYADYFEYRVTDFARVPRTLAD